MMEMMIRNDDGARFLVDWLNIIIFEPIHADVCADICWWKVGGLFSESRNEESFRITSG